MNRRGRGVSAAMLALLAGAAGSLASCGLIVGDYVVGDAGTDATEDQANEGGGGEDVVSVDRVDTGGGDVMRDVTDVTTADMVVDAVNEQEDAKTDQDSGADADGADADSETGSVDADAGSQEAEAGVQCGQGIPTAASDFQTLVSTCVLATSCDPYLFPLTLSQCITQNALQASTSFTCLSTITSCSGTTNSYYSCEGVRYATMSECPGLTSTCDTTNQLAIDCNYGSFSGIVTDCNRTPSSCQIYADSGTSSSAACIVAGSCNPADAAAQCSGDNRYFCVPIDDGGVGVGRNCGNANCVISDSGANCQFNGSGPCTNVGSQQCNGNTLQSCDTNGQAFNYDCTRAGGSCVTDNGGSSCVSTGCSRNSACTEVCNGSSVTVCVGGAAYTIDCTHYGFSACGTTGGTVYCIP